MGKVEDMVILARAPSERLPLLGQAAPSTPTYLSQEEVVQRANAAPWPGLRRALVCLLGVLFACLLSMAVLLLLTLPRPPPPLTWWQKAAFYHLPPDSFPDSNGDDHGDLTGVRHQLDQLSELPIQALVLGPILERNIANLSRILPVHGSLQHLRALVDDGLQKGIRLLLELPAWEEELDPATEDNQTGQHLQAAMEFWEAQGVHGFLVNKDPAWRLEKVLNAWSALDSQRQRSHGQERVLIIWNESETCNISRRVPSSVILTCYLPPGRNLTVQALAQWVEGPWGVPGRPWPSWTAPQGFPREMDLETVLGVLVFTLPGVPLLQGGKDSPLPLDKKRMKESTLHPPLANLYRSLLALHANRFSLRGTAFVPLTLHDEAADLFAFFRPSSCSGALVVLNLGSQPSLIHLNQLHIPAPAKVIFSTHSEPQTETEVEAVKLAPHQAVVFRVLGGQ
ncbi:uncharacterized protein LOC140702069 isoform X2 [Pogona vitticeps]